MTIHSPKNLPRMKLHYTGATGNHSLTLHLPSSGVVTDAITLAAAAATAFKALIGSAYSFTSADFAPALTNVFNPIAFTPVTGTNTNGAVASQKAGVMSFTGKTLIGTRIAVMIFTDQGWSITNYRVTTPLPASVNTALAFLNNPASGFVAADGNVATFHTYANFDSNEHYVKRLRRG